MALASSALDFLVPVLMKIKDFEVYNRTGENRDNPTKIRILGYC